MEQDATRAIRRRPHRPRRSVDVLDADGNAFVTARITMHVSKKR
ncbi:hypothetical protein [Nocardia fluminea]